jgi:hypothetical protein
MADYSKLQAAYPNLYPSLNALQHPVGWASIVERLSERLKDKPITFFFAREKYGGLNFQFDGPTDPEIATILKDAEDESLRTCAVCGEFGTMRVADDGWMIVLCDQHNTPRAWSEAE